MATTIKVGRDFTGYYLVRHKCGNTKRVWVGQGFLRGYAPCGRKGRYDGEYMDATVTKCALGYNRLVTECQCGASVNVEMGNPVYGRYAEAVVCNDKCMGATGNSCDCSCGGMNHGASH